MTTSTITPTTGGPGALTSAATFAARVDDFLAHQRIAVVGVSRDDSKHPVGNLIYHRLRRTGHQVFAVNPYMDRFEGDPCYPDVRSIPGGIDGVVIITRPEITEQIVRDCHVAGVRRVWMHGSPAQGSSVSAEAVRFCHERGISVIAGACPMMFGPGVDFGHRCMRWYMNFTGGMPT